MIPGPSPPDEDPIPENAHNFGQAPFAFFGLGQEGPGPQQNQQHQPPGHLGQQQQGPPAAQQQPDQANNWDFWPDVLPAIGQPVVLEQEALGEQQQPALMQDLNAIPEQEDPFEVIIHPPLAAVENVHDNELDWAHLNAEMEIEIAQAAP